MALKLEDLTYGFLINNFLSETLTAEDVARMDMATFAEQVIFNGEVKLYPTQSAVLKCFRGNNLTEEELNILNSWKEEGRTTWVPGRKYTNLVMSIGRRGSKSSMCSFILLYEFIKLVLMPSPSKHYKLLPGDAIGLFCTGLTETQILETTFAKIIGYAKNSNFIRALEEKGIIEILKGEIRCPDKNIILKATHSASNSDSLRGYALKTLLLDEAAFFGKDEMGRFKADRIYSDVGMACRTFGKEGLKIAISSPEGMEDYIEHLFEVSKRDPNTVGFNLRTWDLNLGSDVSEEAIKSSEEYVRDPIRGALEFEGIRSGSKGEFIHKDLVEKAQTGISAWDANPIPLDITNVGGDTRYYAGVEITRIEKADPSTQSFIHVDFGIKKDSAALCCCSPLKTEQGWKINIDGYLVWKPYKSSEEGLTRNRIVSFLDVEAKLLELAQTRYAHTVSFDIFQSQTAIQRLHMLGINTVEMGVSRAKQELYFSILKQMLTENNLIMPRDNRWQTKALLELINLIQLPNGKITHYSEDKDLADAIANSVYQCYMWMSSQRMLGSDNVNITSRHKSLTSNFRKEIPSKNNRSIIKQLRNSEL